MPKKTGTAREYILATLKQYPDRELQVADFHGLCDERFSKANLQEALSRLFAEGVVTKVSEANRATWWAIKA